MQQSGHPIDLCIIVVFLMRQKKLEIQFLMVANGIRLMINLQRRDVSKTLYLLGMFLFDQDIPQFSTPPDYLIFSDNYFSPNSLLLPKSPYCVLNNANLCPLCGFFPVLSPSAPIPFPFNKLVACTPSP